MSDDNLCYLSTENIIVQNKEIKHSKIWLVESLFGNWNKTNIYEDIDKKAEILNFGVDNTRKRLIILSGIKNQKQKRDKFITLYDIVSEKVLYTMMIHSREIIGRLKSNLYNFVEGHIYYGNKVIKVRYDLLSKIQNIQEH